MAIILQYTHISNQHVVSPNLHDAVCQLYFKKARKKAIFQNILIVTCILVKQDNQCHHSRTCFVPSKHLPINHTIQQFSLQFLCPTIPPNQGINESTTKVYAMESNI